MRKALLIASLLLPSLIVACYAQRTGDINDSLRLPREPRRMDGLGVFTDVERWEVK